MKKFRLLSFLCLLVIGWGNAWADDVYANSYKGEYPYTWDFTNWTSTIGAQVTVEGETKTIEAYGWYYSTDHFGYNTNSGSNFAYMYKDGQPVMSLVGSTHSGGNMSSYIYVPETKGLQFIPGNNTYSRINYYTDGTGISIYASSIVIPNLSYGNIVKFYTNNARKEFTITGFNGTDFASTSERGEEIEFAVPEGWTSGTAATFLINGAANNRVKKIEVTKTPTYPYYNAITVGGVSSLQGSFRNGAATVTADENPSIRFEFKEDNNSSSPTFDLKQICGVATDAEVTSEKLAEVLTVTTSDGSVIDLSNVSFRKSDNRVYLDGVKFYRGEATLTLSYKGNNGYEASSVSTVVTVEGVPVKFDLYNEDWDISEIYIDNNDANLRKFLTLKSSANSTQQNFNTSVECTVEYDDEETTHAVTLKSFRYYDATRLDIYLAPNKLGTCTFKVTYPGDKIHNNTVYYFDVTVKQHIAELEWVDGNNADVEKITTTTIGSLANAPILKTYKDYVETALPVVYTSSNTSVATVDANGNVTVVAPGITVIQATINPDKKVVDGVSHYYYNEASDSYTLVVENTVVSGDQPRIVWITAVRDQWSQLYNDDGRGSYLGWKYCGSKGESVSYEAGYGNDVSVSAIALKSTITDEQLATAGILPVPGSGYTDHYYVMDSPNNYYVQGQIYWNAGDWRAWKNNCIPHDWLFDADDIYQNNITYMVDRPADIRSSQVIAGTGVNKKPTSIYRITPAYPNHEPLNIIAYVPGYNAYSTTPVLVTPGNLKLRFVPDHNTVNEQKSIMPYVNCPDLRMEDVRKIYLTYECDQTLYIPNDGVVYETGKTSTADIAKYLDIVTSNDTIWNNSENHTYGVKEIKAVTWLRGINPEIYGVNEGTCTVTLHLESEMYETATADYTLNVVPVDGPMFHWEMNDIVADGKHVDDGVKKKITIAQGDFIYMPGIVGNANGNTQYSQPDQNKYMYGIQNGVIIMNYKQYFAGEGIPNYYVSYTENGDPSVPESGATTNQPVIVSWATGLDKYWRYDSLMVYGNQPGIMYLNAQDAQTGAKCTPIEIEVIRRTGVEGDLLDQKHDALDDMSYPFTWDFEHIDMTNYVKDATNGLDGNGGTYWRKEWTDDYDQSNVDKAYNRDYRKENDYYQYNGGFNADWDDKDGNSSSRQRWFKDIYCYDDVKGKIAYAPEFKGMMLNLSGLDYWEQKYQRFLIHKDGDFITFKGGPIFVQLPGFGLLDKKGGVEDGTRSHDNYIGMTHNHINTAKYNVNKGYTRLLSVDNQHNVDIQYPVQTTNAKGEARDYRNNKVRFVIKARGGRTVVSDEVIPNNNGSSQFHIGGASMINEDLDVNDINWINNVHNGYSYYNLSKDEAKVYIVELDPYDPELQDHIYLMFNNDVDVYWMAITNEPRNILSDFDGVTYAYPKDIDMDKTNQTLAQQTTEGIYTKSNTENGTWALASEGEHTIKNVYQVGSDEPGAGTKVQLKAYKVSSFDPSKQSVSLTEIEGNIPKNEGVMLYTEPRMSTLAAAGGHIPGLTAEHYDRGATAYSWWETKTKVVNGKTVEYKEEKFDIAPDSTFENNKYNNSHNYYTFPLYFIAMAENMSKDNYDKIAPASTGSQVDPTIQNDHVTTENLLRPVTYGAMINKDYTYDNYRLINFGYNNEFICRKLVYQEMSNGELVQTKEMADPYVTGSGSNTHEGMYYYKIGIDNAKFYRINTQSLNHHNRSAYLTLTWDEYKVNTVGKPINMATPAGDDPDSPVVNSYSPIRFSPSYNPVDILFDSEKPEEQLVSEDAGIPDGIDEVEHSAGDDKVYNLNGVRVNTLSKGIYIINGKKVVVK